MGCDIEIEPRIFVGTMHSGEGDFQECIDMIRKQKSVCITHILISGLPEKEAHNALWHAWRTHKNEHDLFVKVDADTILIDEGVLARIWRLYATNPRLTGVQAPLYDHMTDGPINGLNSFHPRVVFNDTQDDLYCDRRVDTNHDIVMRDETLPADLRPAGLHCTLANDRQAFHYGLHRALKNQAHIIARVHAAYERQRDRIRRFVLLGAAAAHNFESGRKFNYQDPEFESAFALASQEFLLDH
jgi:hypothetical protein